MTSGATLAQQTQRFFWIKGLLANNGLVIRGRNRMAAQINELRLWNGAALPPQLKSRLVRYAEDFDYHSDRIESLEQ